MPKNDKVKSDSTATIQLAEDVQHQDKMREPVNQENQPNKPNKPVENNQPADSKQDNIDISKTAEDSSDLSKEQLAILKGKDLTELEETAAGGESSTPSANGVSLSNALFSEQGHYSNISENFRNLDNNSRSLDEVKNISGYAESSEISDNNENPEHENLPMPQKIEIPTSAYIDILGSNRYNNTEKSPDYFTDIMNNSSHKTYDVSNPQNFIGFFAKDIPQNYTISVDKNSNGFDKAYLEYPDQEFTLYKGWYVNKDKTIFIGTDNSEPLAITDSAHKDLYDNPLVLDHGKPISIYGSDKDDMIEINGVNVKLASLGSGNDAFYMYDAKLDYSVFGGTGDDVISLTNVECLNGIVGGEGNDYISTNDSYIAGVIEGNAGDDIIASGKTRIIYGIEGGSGNDEIAVSDSTIGGNKPTSGYIVGQDGNDEIRVTNSFLKHDVQGGKGNDTIEIDRSEIYHCVGGNADDDKITIKNSKVFEDVLGDEGNEYSPVRDGNDTITIENTFVRDVIQGNGGNDTINLRKVTANSIEGNDGDDKINVSESKFNYTLGQNGDDTISVDNSEGKTIAGNNGNDSISSLKNKLTFITGGDSDDKIDSTDDLIAKYIDGGNGNDEISVTKTTVETIIGGKGDDTFTLKESHISNNVLGQFGNDTAYVDGSYVMNLGGFNTPRTEDYNLNAIETVLPL